MEAKNKVLSLAINEYETLSRPSFKKLLYRNNKNTLKNELIEGIEKPNGLNWRKKSVKSYYEH